MSDHLVVMAVASYPSRSAAATDFHGVWAVEHPSRPNHMAAGIVEKGVDGELEMNRYDDTATNLSCLAALLGSALIVIAAPLGILFLASVLATGDDWAGAGVMVGRFWYDIPKDQLRKMANLLEDGQTALVVVAVDHCRQDIAALLSNSTSMIVTDSTRVEFDADFARPIKSATAQSPAPSPSMADEGIDRQRL